MGPVEERPEHEARFLAWDVPSDAQIIGLVHSSWQAAEDAQRNARAADTIATALARRREHTLLASCESTSSALDELLGGAEGEGLQAALEGRVGLSQIAVRRGDRPFVYLPTGEEPVEVASLIGSETFRRFVERVRERRGTLLLYMPEEVLADEAISRLLDGYLTLGEVYTRPVPPTRATELGRLVLEDDGRRPAGRGLSGPGAPYEAWPEPEGAPDSEAVPETSEAPVGEAEVASGAATEAEQEEARAERLADPAGAAAGGATGESGNDPEGEAPQGPPAGEKPAAGAGSGGWGRHRKPARPPLGRIAIGIGAVAVLAAAWWWIASGALESGGTADAVGAVEAAAGDPEEVPPSREEMLGIVEAAPELRYSVLIASFAARPDAEERLDRLRDGETLYFLAPTPVRGALYYRVFAGARPDPAAGRRLMDELVSSGRKPSASDWDVRPAGLAFRLGVYAERDAAEMVRQGASEAGVHSYLLPAVREADTVYQVLAGAYESDSAARAMAEMLESAGVEAELAARRGMPR